MKRTCPLAPLAAVLIGSAALAAPDQGALLSPVAPAQAAPMPAAAQGPLRAGDGSMGRPASSTPTATASTVRAKKAVRSRAARRARPGYGFLPGYEPPPPVDRYGNPVGPGAYRGWDGPRYWSRGRWYYGWGGPGFYRGRWNGGSFGPCYTTTPIGMMWTCGR